MTYKEKTKAVLNWYSDLCSLLKETHENIHSCNNDISAYLIPRGTIADLSYYGKPANSFRVSDHWNWYSSLHKCDRENYIQCYSVNAPWARKRPAPGKASKPVRAIQVCYFGADKKYHVVYGECWNRKTRSFEWIESYPGEVIRKYLAS